MTFEKLYFLNVNHFLGDLGWSKSMQDCCKQPWLSAETLMLESGSPSQAQHHSSSAHTQPWLLSLAPWSLQPLVCELVTRRVCEPMEVLRSYQSNRLFTETLRLFSSPGCFVRWDHCDPLGRNNAVRLVCSITGMQGTAGWAVWLRQCVERGAQPSLTKGYCFLLF